MTGLTEHFVLAGGKVRRFSVTKQRLLHSGKSITNRHKLRRKTVFNPRRDSTSFFELRSTSNIEPLFVFMFVLRFKRSAETYTVLSAVEKYVEDDINIKMHKEKIMILVLAGFGAGIAIRSFFALGWPYAVLAVLFSVASFVFWKLRKKEFFAAAAVFLLAFGFGFFRYDIRDRAGISEGLRPFVGEQILIRGIVIDEPDERENSTRMVIKTSEVLDWQTKKLVVVSNDKILIFAPRYPEFKYGDILQIRGKLQKPENFTDEFSWGNFLAKDDIFLQIFYPQIEKIGTGEGGFIKTALFGLKNKYLESLGQVLPEPHAALVGGLTVGAKRAMPKELLEDFRKVGVIHIVVLSGYNITIIAKAVASFFSLFLPWFAGVVTGIIGIAAFAVLAGGSATVVRASIMAILIYFARMTGDVYRAAIALFIAGFFMLMHNPRLLRFDVSFQLSFLATLGLIFISPKIEKYLKFIPKKFNLREVAAATISAQIAVTPFILQNMGTFSVVALPVNLLVLLTVPAAMLFGALAGVVGILSSALATPFSWIAYVILAYELKVVSFFAGLSLAEINFSYFPIAATFALYGVIVWFAFIRKSVPARGRLSLLDRWRLRNWKIEGE